jgi:hypothetical protein
MRRGGGRNRSVFRLPHLGLVPINDTKDVSAAAIVQGSFQSKLSSSKKKKAADVHDDDGADYVLGVVEESDFVDLAKLIVEAFGTEVVRIGSDANAFEKMMMAPAIEFLNGSSSLVAFAEVMAGLRYRLRQRHAVDLAPPDLKVVTPKKQNELVSRMSLVFAVSRQGRLIATVELRLQPCDAKIPFSFPTIDQMERNLAAAQRRRRCSNRRSGRKLPTVSEQSLRGKITTGPRHREGSGQGSGDDHEYRVGIRTSLSTRRPCQQGGHGLVQERGLH